MDITPAGTHVLDSQATPDSLTSISMHVYVRAPSAWINKKKLLTFVSRLKVARFGLYMLTALPLSVFPAMVV